MVCSFTLVFIHSIIEYNLFIADQYFLITFNIPSPISMKPIVISDMYRYGSAMAKYKFEPIIGSTNLDTASSTPPAMSSEATSRVFCLKANPNDAKNNPIDGSPRYIPLC